MKSSLHAFLKILLFNIVISWVPCLGLAQWSSPVNISPDAVSAILNESMGPCIGVCGDTVQVVWADRLSTTRGAIYYTRSADTGLSWTHAIAISDTNVNAFNPAIAVNGSSIHVVWREIDTLNQHRSSHYRHSLDGGNTWGPDLVVDTVVADWPAVAVSGNSVYIANDIVTSSSPYNTEIFFLKSQDNGMTWSTHRQLTFADGRSEDEAIAAQGSDVYMSWNDNRSGQMQIFYKHSGNYGETWDSDFVVTPPFDYGTMVSVDGANVDIPSAGAPSGHYQILLVQSADSGSTWGTAMNLTNDPANTYYYPFMVRDGSDLHLTYVKSGVGGQYLHSGDGGATWDPPFSLGFSNITPFIAYSGCVLHIIVPDSGHINYFRNPTGNAGSHCITTTGISILSTPVDGARIYPNPFFTETTVEISTSEIQQNAFLEIFDVFGREIIRSEFGNSNKIIIRRNMLKSGIYFYTVYSKEKMISTGKIIEE